MTAKGTLDLLQLELVKVIDQTPEDAEYSTRESLTELAVKNKLSD